MTSRLVDKLKAAAQGSKTITTTLETRADELIARQAAVVKQADAAFAPHEEIASEAEDGTKALEAAIGQLSNT